MQVFSFFYSDEKDLGEQQLGKFFMMRPDRE